MRLEDMLKGVSGITQKVVDSNCFQGSNTLLENILLIQTKVNEVIKAINDGIIKGDKGDKGETGETGAKGDKGDTGKATESIQDNVTSLDTTWSSTKIDNCFNDLKNIQGVKYGNDVGYQVCKGTHNGIVKDLKIYGKSLVNLKDEVFKYDNVYMGVTFKHDLEPNKTYTVILNGFNKDNFRYHVCYNGDGSQPVYSSSEKIVVFNTPSDLINNDRRVYLYPKEGYTITQSDIDTLKPVILEGDHTQNPPSGYFEGIASVGNGNEIEVSSYTSNLFSSELELGFINSNGSMNSTDKYLRSKDFIKVFPSLSYIIYEKNDLFSSYVIFEFDENKKLIKRTVGNKVVASVNTRYIKATFAKTGEPSLSGVDIKNVFMLLNIGTDKKEYTAYKQDKKTILFKDADSTWKPVTNLRGIDETNCDVIDNVNTKLIKKYENVTINSSNGFKLVQPSSNVKTTQFWNDGHTLLPKILKNNKKIICDKLNIDVTTNKDEEFFLNGSVSFVISLNKEKASTLEQLDEYLSQNPITFVYEILTEEYEINPLYPESNDNETMILFNTGVIPCKNEFYIDSNLGSLQIETNERLSRIENTLYQSNISILRGDFRTLAQMYYPNDFIKKEELPNE